MQYKVQFISIPMHTSVSSLHADSAESSTKAFFFVVVVVVGCVVVVVFLPPNKPLLH